MTQTEQNFKLRRTEKKAKEDKGSALRQPSFASQRGSTTSSRPAITQPFRTDTQGGGARSPPAWSLNTDIKMRTTCTQNQEKEKFK